MTMTTPTGAGLAVCQRAATRIGVPLAEYLERQANGERHCPRCRRWLDLEVYGMASRCLECLADIKRGGKPAQAPRYRGGGPTAVAGRGPWLVFVDDREAACDLLKCRARTREEADMIVRRKNAEELARRPGLSPTLAPLWYCVREREEREGEE